MASFGISHFIIFGDTIVSGSVDILNKLTPYGLFKLTPIDNL